MIIIIPLPLFFSSVIYGVKGFTAWVVIGIIWTFMSAFTVVCFLSLFFSSPRRSASGVHRLTRHAQVLYPLFESRVALFMIGKGVVKVNNASVHARYVLLTSPTFKDLFTKGSGQYTPSQEVAAA